MSKNIIRATVLSFLLVLCSSGALAVVTDTSISGGPPNTKLTLFGPTDASSTTDTTATDTTATDTNGTTVETDEDGNFQFVCTEGERYTIGRDDGRYPDTFVCQSGGLVCLADVNAVTRPIIRDMPASESVGAKAGETVKGLAGGLLGIGGGPLGGLGGGGGPRMAGKPKGPWAELNSGDTGIELTGWIYQPRSKKKKPEIRFGIRIADSPDKGAPHMMMLQNQNGDMLLPVGYMVFELWRNWKLTITVTRETYVDGQLVSREVSQSSYSWKELLDRYVAVLEAPSIWEQLGGDDPKAFGKFKGIIVQYELPENFNPAQWSLVSHVTSKSKYKDIPESIRSNAVDQRKEQKADTDEVLLTVPFVASLAPGKKKNSLAIQPAANGRTYYQISHACP